MPNTLSLSIDITIKDTTTPTTLPSQNQKKTTIIKFPSKQFCQKTNRHSKHKTESDNRIVWIHSNSQGTPVLYSHPGISMTKNDGTKVEQSATITDPWGNREVSYAPIGHEEPLVYTGKELDAETELYYFNARFYDSELGGMLNWDPAPIDYSNPMTINRFAFCWNNPVRYVDPDGRNPVMIAGGIIGGISGGLGAAGGAYLSGSNWKTIAKAGSLGAVGGAVSGAFLRPEGVIASAKIGMLVGSTTSAISSISLTLDAQLSKGSFDKFELINNTLESVFQGGLSGTFSGLAGGLPGGGFLSFELGLSTDLALSPLNLVPDLNLNTFPNMMNGANNFIENTLVPGYMNWQSGSE